jgi:hypothetical protein
VALQSDPIADLQSRDVGTDLDDGAGTLVAQDHRQVQVECLRGWRPLVELAVGAAQGCRRNFDDDVAGARLGVGGVGDVLGAALGGCLHYCPHGATSHSLGCCLVMG